MKKIIINLVFKGRIPYLMFLKKVLFYLALITPFLIMFVPGEFRVFGSIGWGMLIGVMLVRPLADVFPDIKLFKSLVLLRREFGIWAANMIIAHFIGYSRSLPVNIFTVLFDARYWSFKNYFVWGILGFLFALPPLLSSSKFMMMKLDKWWKRIQKLTYLFFIFGGIHVALVGNNSGFSGIIVVAFFWILAELNFQVKIPLIGIN